MLLHDIIIILVVINFCYRNVNFNRRSLLGFIQQFGSRRFCPFLDTCSAVFKPVAQANAVRKLHIN